MRRKRDMRLFSSLAQDLIERGAGERCWPDPQVIPSINGTEQRTRCVATHVEPVGYCELCSFIEVGQARFIPFAVAHAHRAGLRIVVGEIEVDQLVASYPG